MPGERCKPTSSIAVLLSAITLHACAAPTENVVGERDPANVILIIGDGMDEQQLTIARNYLAGSKRGLTVDNLPGLASVRVQTVAENDPEQFVYVADSANTATTLATGSLTSVGRISRDTTGQVSLPTIVEQAHAAGYRTGIVSTASVTDATPAAFASHAVQRKCEGPQSLASAPSWIGRSIDCSAETIHSGRKGSIATQLVNAPLDVLLGGGMQYFAQRGFGGEEQPLAHAKARGWWLATNSAELAAAPLDKPLLGLFADKNLPVALIGARQRKAESVADKPKLAAEVFSCIDNPDAASAPSLQVMTEKALATLGRDRQRGFFLMIESASIDKQSHSRQPCGHIGELEQLEQALRSALAFATERPNTLILVTADHGHAAQIIPEQDQLDAGYATAHSPGAVARVRTPEGSIMMVNYATSTSDYEMHTGTNVPLYASGPGSDELPSYLTQVDVYRLMQQFLGL